MEESFRALCCSFNFLNELADVQQRHRSAVPRLRGVVCVVADGPRDGLSRACDRDNEHGVAAVEIGVVVEVGAVVGLAHDGEGQQDRKSTRLNSSHVSSSYAVFCLKKKKTTGDKIVSI